MNREDIKTILSKKGVNEKMLEMPAIIEPLYKRFMNSPKSELENEEVKVDEKGGFTYLGKIYSVKDEGVQIDIPGEDATVQVNKYGIETSYYDGSWMGFFQESREKMEK